MSNMTKESVIYILHALAIPSCMVRLFYRKHTHRLGWDDLWAFIALVFDCAMVIAINIHTGPGNTGMTSSVRWAILITFSSTLWGSRLSIAVAIVRLVPPGCGHRIAKSVSVLFGVTWIIIIVQKSFICGGSPNLNIAKCKIPKETGILELCTDLMADIWLICSPACLLWNLKLSRQRQVLVLSIFASNVLLSASSIVHSVFIINQRGPFWIGYTAQIEVAISLMMCNLLVLATWIYSRFYPTDETDDSYTSSQSTPWTRRRPNGPIYGFEGSVLALTEISGSSMSRSAYATLDNLPLKYTANSDQPRPRSRSLDGLCAIRPPHTGTLSLSLRRVQSCPAIVNFHIRETPKKPKKAYNISWKDTAEMGTTSGSARRMPPRRGARPVMGGSRRSEG
ncbi:hypothetical protein P691DRAFT_773649 [Macrolepiota fuliginosa MF-IS2]|uniref:Rhodopsin domain-containing protein n=1 Tax=Macrolepiota fuliginosa MF-IS2 TaxID=1400762 RepID=A0A9P5XG05_9AGAR|nr:hypothetical protein P691DRAFT_773649 [Macrolepiota fuliginosa MF-IS2]